MGDGSGFTTNRCEMRIRSGAQGGGRERKSKSWQRGGGRSGRAGSPGFPELRNAGISAMRGFLSAPPRSLGTHAAPAPTQAEAGAAPAPTSPGSGALPIRTRAQTPRPHGPPPEGAPQHHRRGQSRACPSPPPTTNPLEILGLVPT